MVNHVNLNCLPLPTPLPLFPPNRRRRWNDFKEDFYDYALSNGVYKLNPEIQISHLRTALGSQCKSKLRSLVVPSTEVTDEQIKIDIAANSPSRRLIATIAAWEKVYCGVENILVNREKFYSCNQESLDIDRYIEKVSELADECEFPAVAKDQLIRDRLVLGLSSSALRDKLLQNEKTDLHSVIAFIRRASKTVRPRSAASDCNAPSTESVNKIRSEKRPPTRNSNRDAPRPNRKCKFCDLLHPMLKSKCPARDQTCSKCRKTGHFAACCDTIRKLNYIDVNDDSDDEIDSVEEDCFNVELGRLGDRKKRIVGDALLRSRDREFCLKAQIDCGASVDVLPYQLYKKLRKLQILPPKTKSTRKLRMYNGDLTDPVGQVSATLVNNGREATVTFQIVDVPEQPLLGASTSLALGYIRLGENAEFVNKVSDCDQEDRLESLVQEYAEIFKGLGKLQGKVKIYLKNDAIPVQCPPRRVPAALKTQIVDRIAELERQGIIVPVHTPTEWISQLLVVARKDKKLRVTLDPFHLNKATRRSHYRLPVLSDILPRLTKAKFFSVADASDGFFQCELDDASTDLTTFWTPTGRYKYLRMPQGLSISPEIYQAKQMEALENLKGIEIIADDILIHGETFEDHYENLRAFFQRCKERHLRLNKKKLRICVPSAKYMGHILTRDGVQPDPEKIEILRNCPPPRDKKALLRFLGAVNYLSKFIPGYSELTTSLRSLLKDNIEFRWMESQNVAFERIKEALAKSPTLAYFDVDKPILIQTDSSQNGVGGVLLQEGRPVDLCSSALRPAELGYAVIEKELLAILVSCKKFDHYIFGHPQVVVQTDHQPLISCFRKPLHSNPIRLQRMLLSLQKYNLEVSYVRGKANCIADWLSRDTYQTTHSLVVDEGLVYRIELENLDVSGHTAVKNATLLQIKEAAIGDLETSLLKKMLTCGWPRSREHCAREMRPFWKYRSELTTDGELIFRNTAVFIPRTLRRAMLTKAHASHYGSAASWKRARDCIFWPSLKSELFDWCDSCESCLSYQPRQQREPLKITTTAYYPFQIVYQDFFTLRDRQYLVTVDSYSDYFEVDDLGRDSSAERLIQATQRHFARYGAPVELHSDNGPQFTSTAFIEFLSEWGVTPVTSSPYFPQGNGKAEAAVKVAKRLLKKCLLSGED